MLSLFLKTLGLAVMSVNRDTLRREVVAISLVALLPLSGCAGLCQGPVDEPLSAPTAAEAPPAPAAEPAPQATGEATEDDGSNGKPVPSIEDSAEQAPSVAAPPGRVTAIPPPDLKPEVSAPVMPPVASPEPAPGKAEEVVPVEAVLDSPVQAPADEPAAAPVDAPQEEQAAAPLDLELLETRLRETRAIGLFTKLALKNQVDDLVAKFRAHYQGHTNNTLEQLRQPYEMLLMKVLALLQDEDPPLARDIRESREAIWGILADPEKFAAY